MAVIRPKLILQYGRTQMPLRVDIRDVLVGDPIKTTITADSASGSGTLTVKNISGFAVNQILLIGEPGTQQAEIIKTHASTPPSGTTITLAANTANAHSSSTWVYVIPFDQIEFSRSTTAGGTKSVLATNSILADQRYTTYNDTSNTSGYYWARFKETIGGTFSTYSDSVQYAGFTLQTAGAVIQAALQEINKQKSEVLSDEFFYTELDMCQSEVLGELKRWSFMALFDQIVATPTTGQWKFTVPTTLADQNTNKSIDQLRLGTQWRMKYVDNEKFDEMLQGVAYTTLAATLNVGDSTMTLTNSGDFGTSGTVTIGANSYAYTANNTSTGVLTLSATVPTGQNAANGADVFLGVQSGIPQYFTNKEGTIYYLPVLSSTYTGYNLYMDFYSAQVQIQADSTNVVFPDPSVAINYLCWKALKKLNNGVENEGSLAYKATYEQRKKIMKNKEVLGKTFKLRPRIQNFRVQTETGSGDSWETRTGSFSNRF